MIAGALLATLSLTAKSKDLKITPDTLPGGTVGVKYSQSLAADGCGPGCEWSSSGTLPPGLSLGSTSGAISGTPKSIGRFPFTIMVADAKSDSGSQRYTVNIKGDPPTITTNSPLPGGQVGKSYSHDLAASGGSPPYTWSVTAGALPGGLSLDPASGSLSGTPTVAGNFTFTVQAVDTNGASGSKAFTLAIAAAPAPALTITTGATLPGGTVGASYSQTISASGGTPPYSFAVTGGSVPPGLSLNASGTLAGTPSSANNFGFTVQVKDASGATATQAFTLAIAPAAPPPLTITTGAALPGGTVGASYSQTIGASGGTPPYSFAVTSGSPPAGLSLNASGTLAGTPTAATNSAFTVQVKDASGATASQAFTLGIINNTPKLTITTTQLPAGTVGVSYSQSIAATGGTPPYNWSVSSGSLPPGLSLTASNGAITGTPSSANTFSFTVQVADTSNATASQAFTITIASNTPKLTVITTSPLPDGMVGTAYSQTLTATGGTPAYKWSVTSGALPDGLALDSGSGTISGTPSKAGTFPFSVRVTDQSTAAADQALQITIGNAPPVPTLAFTGVPSTAASGQQTSFGLVLSSPAGQAVSGQVTLSFKPDATVATDDPAIQFANGGRTAQFNIAAGATKATFPVTSMAFQTGTVAGTITLTVTSNASNGSLSQAVVVGRAAPVIQSATIVPNSSGFQVQISGFSNTRDLAGASFHFTAVSGQALQTSDLSVNLSSPASQWYGGGSSTQFGGQFLLLVPFTVQQGAESGLSTVSVQLQNGQSTSAAATAKF